MKIATGQDSIRLEPDKLPRSFGKDTCLDDHNGRHPTRNALPQCENGCQEHNNRTKAFEPLVNRTTINVRTTHNRISNEANWQRATNRSSTTIFSRSKWKLT